MEEAKNIDELTDGTVVYKKDFNVGEDYPMSVVLYFPDTYHSNYSGGSDITNASLAEIHLIKGKWHNWWLGATGKADYKYASAMDQKLQLIYTGEVKRWKNERRNALRRKIPRTELQQMAMELEALKEDRRRNFGDYDDSLKRPDFQWMYPQDLGLKEQFEWEKNQKSAWKAKRESFHRLVSQITSHQKEIKTMRDFFAARYSSDMKREELESLSDLFTEAQLSGDRTAVRTIQTQIELITNPHMFAASVSTQLKRGAKECREILQELLYGSKAPWVEERTQDNRRQRGHPETPALNETGEFIESLKWKVI